MGKAQRRMAELEARVALLEDQNERAGQAEFEAECLSAQAGPEPRDNEADFQDLLRSYDLRVQIERLLRVAYLCGVADAQTPAAPANTTVDTGGPSATTTWRRPDGMWSWSRFDWK